MTCYRDVGEFHRKFGLAAWPSNEEPPQLLDWDTFLYRLRFLHEELGELLAAQQRGSVADAADALVDLTYVALGTAHLMRLPFDSLWAEVQRANLAKERASSAGDPRTKRNHTLDVVKPAGWRPPEIERVLREHGWIDLKVGDRVHVEGVVDHEGTIARVDQKGVVVNWDDGKIGLFGDEPGLIPAIRNLRRIEEPRP